MAELSFSLGALFEQTFGYKTKAFDPQFSQVTSVKNPFRKEQGTQGSSYYAKNASGAEYYMPVTLTYPDTSPLPAINAPFSPNSDTLTILKKWNLPYPVISVNSKKTIIETALTERRGTVKELINIQDYEIVIKGFIIGANGEFPEGEIAILRTIYEQNVPLSTSGPATLKELLNNAVSGTNGRISVECDLDVEFSNVNFKDECGFDIINSLSKYTDENLSCFFIRPDRLWCGLLYSHYADGRNILNLPLVKYRMGYNIIHDNNLKERNVASDPIQVKYSNKLPDGTKISQTSDVFEKYVRTHNKILKQIKEELVLKKLAKEKAYQSNYTGCEGNINAFLEPYAEPGYQVYISDRRYPERDGIYLAESTDVSFGISGARRKIEIGPRSGFAK